MKHMIHRLAALSAVAAVSVPSVALAHTGVTPHDHAGFVAGLLHPLTGADHIAAMVSVGVWAAAIGGRAIWIVPLSFVSLLTLGAVGGALGLPLPAVEPMIAISIIFLGLLLALHIRVPTPAAAALVGFFALFHGHAHGAEMPAFSAPIAYGLGFVAATIVLHACGIAAGLGLGQSGKGILPRLAGAAAAAFGAVLLVAG